MHHLPLSVMARQGKKMIGIYVDEKLYEEIKRSAAESGKSIKDYFIDLHSGPKSETADTVVERLKQELTEGELRQILASIVARPVPSRRVPEILPERVKEPSRISKDTFFSKQPKKVMQIPKFVDYLNSLNNRRQREAIRDTLQVIINHGGSTTSSVIKKERGFTRTTIANRQLDRLIRDGILVKDSSVTPFIVTLAPEWRV